MFSTDDKVKKVLMYSLFNTIVLRNEYYAPMHMELSRDAICCIHLFISREKIHCITHWKTLLLQRWHIYHFWFTAWWLRVERLCGLNRTWSLFWLSHDMKVYLYFLSDSHFAYFSDNYLFQFYAKQNPNL
jgi:hypothetical protein